MARVGLLAPRRRGVDRRGRVSVNASAHQRARNVTEADSVLVDGKPLATRERTRLFMFHKPRGLVTTDRDPRDAQPSSTLSQNTIPPCPAHVDRAARHQYRGLLLVTNDGGLAACLSCRRPAGFAATAPAPMA